MSTLLAFLILCICDVNISAYQRSGRTVSSTLNQKHIDQPVIKSLKRPILTVVDPKTKSRIHLIGVSHGSDASAELVKQVISETLNPAAVVLELCEDRFFAISVDANIRPRGNETYAKVFDMTSEKLVAKKIERKALKADSGLQVFLSDVNNTLRFASGKGLIGGVLVLLLLLTNSARKMIRSNSGASFDVLEPFDCKLHSTFEERYVKLTPAIFPDKLNYQ